MQKKGNFILPLCIRPGLPWDHDPKLQGVHYIVSHLPLGLGDPDVRGAGEGLEGEV